MLTFYACFPLWNERNLYRADRATCCNVLGAIRVNLSSSLFIFLFTQSIKSKLHSLRILSDGGTIFSASVRRRKSREKKVIANGTLSVLEGPICPTSTDRRFRWSACNI